MRLEVADFINWKVTLGVHIMTITDNTWTARVRERQPRESRGHDWQRNRWRDEIRTFAGAGWRTPTLDKEKVENIGKGLSLAMD